MRFSRLPPLVFLVGSLQAAPAADASLFAYDATAPLDVKIIDRSSADGALRTNLTFRVIDSAIGACLVAPVDPDPSAVHPAVLYVHWLGEPDTSNRTEFLAEAVSLARDGVVSLLVDAMWSRPRWYVDRVPEEDYAHSIRQVIELRRALDLLLAQSGVDASRVAYVGHDFGAMYGTILGGIDHRAKTYVFMAPTSRFIDWALYARQPKDPEAFRARLAPLDPVNFLPALGAPVFFQFSDHDGYVPPADAAEYYAAAVARKQMATYHAGHDLHTSEVAADRVAWLRRELALPLPPAPRR